MLLGPSQGSLTQCIPTHRSPGHKPARPQLPCSNPRLPVTQSCSGSLCFSGLAMAGLWQKSKDLQGHLCSLCLRKGGRVLPRKLCGGCSLCSLASQVWPAPGPGNHHNSQSLRGRGKGQPLRPAAETTECGWGRMSSPYAKYLE